jgi:hypothetical protein
MSDPSPISEHYVSWRPHWQVWVWRFVGYNGGRWETYNRYANENMAAAQVEWLKKEGANAKYTRVGSRLHNTRSESAVTGEATP